MNLNETLFLMEICIINTLKFEIFDLKYLKSDPAFVKLIFIFSFVF